MNYEYLAIQRSCISATTLHEQTDLAEFLNGYAKDGWRLKHIIVLTNVLQLVVFEREVPLKLS